MTPQPSERPRDVLEEMINQNSKGLGRLRTCLDWSIQLTCASWVAKHEGRAKLTDLEVVLPAAHRRRAGIRAAQD